MCLICVEMQKNKLTIHEAWRNLSEMTETLSPDHIKEVKTLIFERALTEEPPLSEPPQKK